MRVGGHFYERYNLGPSGLGPELLHRDRSNFGVGRRAQYDLIKECGLNYEGIHNMIEAIFLN